MSPAELVGALIAAAKTWRGLARLVVIVLAAGAEQAQEVVVKLGESRRRWKRVAVAIEPIAHDIVGARGYDAEGQLVGAWDAPDDEPDTEPAEVHSEPAEYAAHRQHTQWVIREMKGVFDGQMRMALEMFKEAIELVRSVRVRPTQDGVSTPEATDDATKTLGMLLAMANQKGATEYADETERDARSQNGGAGGQGQPAESGQAGPGANG
jgi:hypothetical protein